jgi:hypothetical protein
VQFSPPGVRHGEEVAAQNLIARLDVPAPAVLAFPWISICVFFPEPLATGLDAIRPNA